MRVFAAVEANRSRLPANWELIALKRVARLKEEPNLKGDAELLSLRNTGELTTRGDDVQPPSLDYIPRYWRVRDDDLVVNPMWLAGGAIGVSRAPGAVSPDYRVYTLSSALEPRFIHHLLRSTIYNDQYRLMMRAETTFDRRVTKQDFAELPILVAPREEQRSIADFLDVETARIDALIEKKQRLSELTRERFVGLRQHLFEHLSRAHGQITLRRVTECLDGGRIPLNAEERSTRQGPYPYWGAGAIVDHIDDYLFDEPLVLLGEDGAPFFDSSRDVAFSIDEQVWVNNHIHVLRSYPGWSPQFVMHMLNAVDYSAYITGSTRDKLTQTEMNDIRLPAPPPDDQGTAVARLQFEHEKTGAVQERLDRQIDLLREHRQALITAAVTGQLDVAKAAA